MELLTCTLLIGAAALAGVGAGFGLARLYDHSRSRSADAYVTSEKARAAEFVVQAQREAGNVLKAAELKGKDEQFSRREEFNREMEQARNALRDQERRVEKREDLADQKHQAQVKKERVLENNQQKLSERREEVEKRAAELEQLVQQQGENSNYHIVLSAKVVFDNFFIQRNIFLMLAFGT